MRVCSDGAEVYYQDHLLVAFRVVQLHAHTELNLPGSGHMCKSLLRGQLCETFGCFVSTANFPRRELCIGTACSVNDFDACINRSERWP